MAIQINNINSVSGAGANMFLKPPGSKNKIKPPTGLNKPVENNPDEFKITDKPSEVPSERKEPIKSGYYFYMDPGEPKEPQDGEPTYYEWDSEGSKNTGDREVIKSREPLKRRIDLFG